jgi:hypothetical protein
MYFQPERVNTPKAKVIPVWKSLTVTSQDSRLGMAIRHYIFNSILLYSNNALLNNRGELQESFTETFF